MPGTSCAHHLRNKVSMLFKILKSPSADIKFPITSTISSRSFAILCAKGNFFSGFFPLLVLPITLAIWIPANFTSGDECISICFRRFKALSLNLRTSGTSNKAVSPNSTRPITKRVYSCVPANISDIASEIKPISKEEISFPNQVDKISSVSLIKSRRL